MQKWILWMQQHLVVTIISTIAVLAVCCGLIALPFLPINHKPTTDTISPVTTTTTASDSLTSTTTTTTTTKTTTRRTVKPPPIIVEPDGVKDDTADRDHTLRPPTTDTININYVKNKFGGNGNLIGIDVSRHNGEIDWKKVKDSGISFAIIRCGYRTTVSGIVYEDANFRKNIEGAIRVGMPIGIYFFSAAKNEYEALEEAAFTIEVLKNYKSHITWPVAFDFEIFDSDRVIGISDTVLSNNARAFMDAIAAEGYSPMLYSSRNMLWNDFETARLSQYHIWMAQYVNTLSQKRYNGDHAIWQCASDGKVDGIRGNVDMNIAYKDLSKAPALLPGKQPSAYPSAFDGFSFSDVCEEIEVNTGWLNARLSPFTDRPNKWTTLPRGRKLLRTGIDTKSGWSRLKIDGTTVYISNAYVTLLSSTEISTNVTVTPSSTSESSLTESSTSTTTN